jgi:hypothetical protein
MSINVPERLLISEGIDGDACGVPFSLPCNLLVWLRIADPKVAPACKGP